MKECPPVQVGVHDQLQATAHALGDVTHDCITKRTLIEACTMSVVTKADCIITNVYGKAHHDKLPSFRVCRSLVVRGL
eukprot:XP_001708136.1 Hypothetical protein GL50803_35352 [Giardia lamblia ATCC 50803]